MKKFLIGCAIAASGFAMPLSAQNYGGPCGPTQCCDPCGPCCDSTGFNGFYVGGNVGVFTHTAFRNDLNGFLSPIVNANAGFAFNETNVEAGVQLGYDWQCCNQVYGLVVDWNWVNTNRRFRTDTDTVFTRNIRSRADWFTTIRGRIGVALCDALFYVTGGAAVVRSNNRIESEVAVLGLERFRDRRSHWGWTAGVGTELMLGCSWSFGAEVLWLHFSERTRTFTSTVISPGTPFAIGASDSAWIARILLNYRFGDLCGCWGR